MFPLGLERRYGQTRILFPVVGVLLGVTQMIWLSEATARPLVTQRQYVPVGNAKAQHDKNWDDYVKRHPEKKLYSSFHSTYKENAQNFERRYQEASARVQADLDQEAADDARRKAEELQRHSPLTSSHAHLRSMPGSARSWGSGIVPASNGVPSTFPLQAATPAAQNVQTSVFKQTKKRVEFAQPDYSYYSTCDGVLSKARDIADQHPQYMKHETMTKTLNGYSAELLVVTVELGDRTIPSENKLRLLLNFGEHGREIVTSDVALRLLHILAKGPEAAADSMARTEHDRRAMASVLSKAVLMITPMENVGGRRRVEAGRICERKNGRGVDTNRNWGVDWGKKAPDYDPSEEFPGTGPLSEPESFLLHQILTSHKPHAWVNVHSGMEALFMPYDHQARLPTGPGPEGMLRILEGLNAAHCRNKCAVGSGGKSVGYLAHGTATDFIFQELHVPVVFTWEIYGDMAAHHDDCFRMFNPVTPEAYEEVVANWAGAFFTLLTLLPLHPELPRELVLADVIVAPAQDLTPRVVLPKTVSADSEYQMDAPAHPTLHTTTQQASQDQLPSEVSSEVDRIPATEKSTIDQSKLLITEVDDNVVLHTLSSEAERVEGDTNWFVIFSIFLVGSVGGSLLSQPVGQLFNRQVRRHRRRRIRDVPV